MSESGLSHSTNESNGSASDADAMQPVACDVLVVDDVATVRLMLARYIKELGHVPTQAADGVEALTLLRAHSFDLVLLDVMMPEMDGYAVLEQMKHDASLRNIPVVMVSGLDELQSAVRCIEAGADDYLTKPFEPTLLRARVRACLERKQLWDQLQERYRQLKQLEELRDSLTSMIVHDLRTPLTSLLTGLQSLPFVADQPEQRDELLDIAINGGETLLGMINDLLDINKMESGGLSLNLASFSAEQAIGQAVRQTAALAGEKGIVLEPSIGANLPLLRADEDKARRILVNLIGNAIKFSPADSTITLKVYRDTAENGTEQVQFSVQDNGEGIPQEAFGRIFEKFGQVESRKAGRKMSTGLGLTFCKMAVEAHSGRIWVESELGKGSVFHFTLPTCGTSSAATNSF